MKVVYVEISFKIAIKDGWLHIHSETESVKISPYDVSIIVIDNTRTSITISTLLELDKYNILCIICDQKHQPLVTVINQHKYYSLTSRLNQQIGWAKIDKFNLAKEIIYQKVAQQRKVIGQLRNNTTFFTGILKKIRVEDNFIQLEALAARVYFKTLFGKTFKRFNDDLTNHALNYVYMCMSAMIAQVTVAKGLHPSLGFVHYSQYNNFNLIYDLIEVYRPLADCHVYMGLKKYKELNKEFKVYLLKIFHKSIFLNGNKFEFRKSVEVYIDKIIDYFECKKQINFPVGII